MKLAALAITVVVSINLIAQKHQSTPVEFGEMNKGDIRSSYKVTPLGEYENDLVYHTTQLFRIDESLKINHVGNKKEFPFNDNAFRYRDFIYSIGRDRSSFIVKKVNMGESVVNELSIPLIESDHRNLKVIQSDDGKSLYYVSVEREDKKKMLTYISIDLDNGLDSKHKTTELHFAEGKGIRVNEILIKDDRLYCLLRKEVNAMDDIYNDFLIVFDLNGKVLTINELKTEKVGLWNTTTAKNPKSGKINIVGLFRINKHEKSSFSGFFTGVIDEDNYGIKNIKIRPLGKEILSYLDDKFEKRGKARIYGNYIPSLIQLKNGGYYAIFERVRSVERKLDELIVYYVDEEGEIQNQNIIPKSQNGTYESMFRHPVQQFFCYTENNTLNIIHNGNIEELEVTTSDKVYSYLLPSAAFHIKIKPTGEMTKRVLFDYKKGTDKFYLKPQSIHLDKSNMTAVGAFTDKKKKAKMGRFSLSDF